MKQTLHQIENMLKQHWITTIVAAGGILLITKILGHLIGPDGSKTIQKILFFVKEHYLPIEILIGSMYIITIAAVHQVKYWYKTSLIAQGSGMFFYSPNNVGCRLEESDDFLRKNPFASTLYIMGATGWATFGVTASPLHKALKTSKEVKIILANPYGLGVSERAAELGMPLVEYQNEILGSIQCLCDLKTGGKDVQLKMYRSRPLWKYIIVSQTYAWVQQYSGGKHVKETPCYAFQPGQRDTMNRDGLAVDRVYHHIYESFLRRWRSHYMGVYNFDTGDIDFLDENGKLYEKTHIGLKVTRAESAPQ